MAASPDRPAAIPPGQMVGASCDISPAVLDVSLRPGPLTVRLELPQFSAGGVSPDAGIHIASVNGVRLPAPSPQREGISERVAARAVEDRSDPGRGLMTPNGVPELIVRFDRPADGDPATLEDGDAGDLLAMLMDVPDGRSVPICIAGRANGTPFECCDTVEVRNRGLRDLPRALMPPPSP